MGGGHQPALALLGDFQQRCGIFQRVPHGFFHQHVLARFQRSFGHHAVFAHGGRDQHQVDVAGRHDFLEVGGEALVAVIGPRHKTLAIGSDIARDDRLDGAPRLEVVDLATIGALHHAATADHTNPNRI